MQSFQVPVECCKETPIHIQIHIHIGLLHAEIISDAFFLYLCKIVFPASLLGILNIDSGFGDVLKGSVVPNWIFLILNRVKYTPENMLQLFHIEAYM